MRPASILFLAASTSGLGLGGIWAWPGPIARLSARLQPKWTRLGRRRRALDVCMVGKPLRVCGWSAVNSALVWLCQSRRWDCGCIREMICAKRCPPNDPATNHPTAHGLRKGDAVEAMGVSGVAVGGAVDGQALADPDCAHWPARPTAASRRPAVRSPRPGLHDTANSGLRRAGAGCKP